MTPNPSPILAPVVALAAWSLVMLGWLVVVRFRAMKAKGISLKGRRGGRGQDLERVVDPEAMWPAHNHTHLMEQPTLFYAVALALAIMGAGGGLNATIAWIYVGLRVAHSIVQSTSNIVPIRFGLFLLATLALIALTLHAAMALL